MNKINVLPYTDETFEEWSIRISNLAGTTYPAWLTRLDKLEEKLSHLEKTITTKTT